MKLKTFFSSILVAAAFACDSTSIPLDTREGQLEIAEEDGDDIDSLVLPYQTTGSFLTMLCRIDEFGSGSRDSVALCRIEDGETRDKYRGEVSWSAKAQGVDITKATNTLPHSASEFNAEIRFRSGYEEETTITATLPEFDGSLTVKPTGYLNDGSKFAMVLKGPNRLTLPKEGSVQDGLREQMNNFLDAGAFCNQYGSYHKETSSSPARVDFSKAGGLGKVGGNCEKGLGGIADGIIGAIDKDADTNFAEICTFNKRVLTPDVEISNISDRCIDARDSIGEGRCEVVSLVDKLHYNSLAPGSKIEFEIIVLARAEVLGSEYDVMKGIIGQLNNCR